MGTFVTPADILPLAAALLLAAALAALIFVRRPRLKAPPAAAWVWGFAALYFAFFAAVTVARHYGLATCGLDLAYYANAVWQFGHGHPFAQTPDPATHGFSQPCTPLLAAFGPLTYVFRGPSYLLVLQSLFLASGIVLVYYVARPAAGPRWPAAALAFGFGLSPLLHGANFYDFHPRALGVPLALAAMLLFSRRRFGAGVACVVLLALAREELALHAVALAAWGGFAAGRRKAGLLVAAGVAAYFVGFCSLLYPKLTYAAAKGAYFYDFFRGGPAGQADVAWDPALWRAKGAYFALLVGPVAALLPAAGWALVTLVTPLAVPAFARTVTVFQLGWQYPLAWLPFLYGAAALGLRRAVKPAMGRARRYWLTAAALAAVVPQLAAIAVFAGKYYRPAIGGAFPTAHETHLREVAARVPRDAAVCAEGNLTPHLAHRRFVYIYFPDAGVAMPAKPTIMLLDRREHVLLEMPDVLSKAAAWNLKLAAFDDDYAWFEAGVGRRAPGALLRGWFGAVEEWQCSVSAGKRCVADPRAHDGRAALARNSLRADPIKGTVYPPGRYELTFLLRSARPGAFCHATVLVMVGTRGTGATAYYRADADVVATENYQPVRVSFAADAPFIFAFEVHATSPIYFDAALVESAEFRAYCRELARAAREDGGAR